LALKAGAQIDQGVSFLIDKWHSWLRYQNPVYENIERAINSDGAVVRILTISDSGQSACSIRFDIKSTLEVSHE
jgi:hypothetical protein